MLVPEPENEPVMLVAVGKADVDCTVSVAVEVPVASTVVFPAEERLDTADEIIPAPDAMLEDAAAILVSRLVGMLGGPIIVIPFEGAAETTPDDGVAEGLAEDEIIVPDPPA